MSDLESVLKGEVEETEETKDEATEESAEQSEETEESSEDKSEEESTETTGEESETPSQETQDTEPEKVPDGLAPVKAVQEERRKRQELEERLKALESQGDTTQQEKKDFWDDPEGHLQGMEEKFNDRLLNERMNISESFARKRWEDLDDKLETFKGMIEQTPSLKDQMLQHPSPWEFVGEQVERHNKFQEFEKSENYRQELEQNFDSKVEEKAKEKAEQMFKEWQEKSDQLPGSAADARQAAGRSESNEDANAAPPSLEEALGKS